MTPTSPRATAQPRQEPGAESPWTGSGGGEGTCRCLECVCGRHGGAERDPAGVGGQAAGKGNNSFGILNSHLWCFVSRIYNMESVHLYTELARADFRKIPKGEAIKHPSGPDHLGLTHRSAPTQTRPVPIPMSPRPPTFKRCTRTHKPRFITAT